jgi:hypothetical protein
MHSFLQTWFRRAATLLSPMLCFVGGLGVAGTPDAGDPLIERGLLSVSLFGATANDDTDDTAAILKTLAAARDRGLATYLPSG